MTAHADRTDTPDRALTGAQVLDAWLAALPDVVAHLEAVAHPRIAEVGCGSGARALAFARAFPHAWIDGYDSDAEEIARARHRAAASGLDAHARFIVGDAGRLAGEWPYDLIVVDGRRPRTREELTGVRAALRHGGTVLVAWAAGPARAAVTSGFARMEQVPVAEPLYRLRA